MLGGRVWYTVKLLHICYNLFAGTEMLSLSVYEPIAIQILLGGRPPIWPRCRARGRVWYPVKLLHISYNLFAETENAISHRLRANRITNFACGTVPQFGGEVKLGGRVWYNVKVLHIRYNLFAGTEMLSSPFTSQLQCKFCLGSPPNFV